MSRLLVSFLLYDLSMALVLIFVIVGLKLGVPVMLLWFPFVAAWGNYVLDSMDGDILQSLGMSEELYQTIDKAADLWSYVFMLAVGWRWRIRKTILILFVYRLVGQVLFFVTRNEFVFVYFQNLLEPLVMIYALLLFKTGSDEKAYAVYKKHLWLIWSIIVGYKLWNEWYLHWANIDLSTIFFGVDGRGVK